MKPEFEDPWGVKDLEGAGMQVCAEACAPPTSGLVLGPRPAPTAAQLAPYPDLDFWILQIDVPLGQQVAICSWLNKEAPHLDKV